MADVTRPSQTFVENIISAEGGLPRVSQTFVESIVSAEGGLPRASQTYVEHIRSLADYVAPPASTPMAAGIGNMRIVTGSTIT